MPRHVIRNGRVLGDIWRSLVPRPDENPETVPLPEGPLAVSLPVWRARRVELLARSTPVGVRLEPGDEPAEIAPDLPRLALVAVHFPKFADGRGYSTASLLRRRHGYRGELRAVGDVLRDQIFHLQRCGFDSFQLREGTDPHAALPSLADFSVAYQAAADGRGPRFRRDAAQAEAAGEFRDPASVRAPDLLPIAMQGRNHG
ncbi:MAG: DUF934 domain-containing protein [Lysobacter sp.]|nr:DUF934 domain-containing protein [Lysobacter sp.]